MRLPSDEEMIMSETIQEKNKALVLDTFDALFNKRDYAAAEKYWSPDYIQHSAHIEPGRDGLFNLIRNAPDTFCKTRQQKLNRKAACRCLAKSFQQKEKLR
jgi:hypothetical protein